MPCFFHFDEYLSRSDDMPNLAFLIILSRISCLSSGIMLSGSEERMSFGFAMLPALDMLIVAEQNLSPCPKYKGRLLRVVTVNSELDVLIAVVSDRECSALRMLIVVQKMQLIAKA